MVKPVIKFSLFLQHKTILKCNFLGLPFSSIHTCIRYTDNIYRTMYLIFLRSALGWDTTPACSSLRKVHEPGVEYSYSYKYVYGDLAQIAMQLLHTGIFSHPAPVLKHSL